MQKDAINEYCKNNNIALSGIFEDAGISGTDPNRPGLNDLLSILQCDDSIIVLQTSRLWRNDTVKVIVHHEVKKIKANIISLDQPNYNIYSKDANDILFNGMLELLDQYERLTIAKRLSKGRKTKAENGNKPAGSAPFGYRWEDAEIVIDYNNHLVVQDIYRIFADNHSVTSTAAKAKAKGYKTSTGKDFSKQSISNMIHNDFYIGVVTHDGKKYQGTHEPIINNALFMSCNPDYVKIL